MKPSEADMKNSAVWVISVLSGLLTLLVFTLIWLENSKFKTENKVSVLLSRVDKLKRENTELCAKLTARDGVIAQLQAKCQHTTTAQDVLLARVQSAEVEAGLARQAAEVSQRELKHAIEQSRKLENMYKGRLTQLEKDKDEVQKLSSNADHLGAREIDALKNKLNSTVLQLTEANAKLQVFQSGDQKVKDLPLTVPPSIPPPARPLSTAIVRNPTAQAIFGQVKAVETKNQFVLIQLNMINGVTIGDALTVTRLGVPVGVLRVYRVGTQNIVFTALTPDMNGKVLVGDEVSLRR